MFIFLHTPLLFPVGMDHTIDTQRLGASHSKSWLFLFTLFACYKVIHFKTLTIFVRDGIPFRRGLYFEAGGCRRCRRRRCCRRRPHF